MHNLAELLIKGLKDAIAPMITTTTLKNTQNEWFSNTLMGKILPYQKAVWYNTVFHWDEHKQHRNYYKFHLDKAKTNFTSTRINNCNDQKTMWKTIKLLVLK